MAESSGPPLVLSTPFSGAAPDQTSACSLARARLGPQLMRVLRRTKTEITR
jgi:hypothetical protein